MNSFVFNVLILNACSLGITQFCCENMPSYTSKTLIYKLTIYVKYSDFMFSITANDIVGKLFLLLSLITIMLNICKGGYRIKFVELDKKYRKEGKIKEEKMKRWNSISLLKFIFFGVQLVFIFHLKDDAELFVVFLMVLFDSFNFVLGSSAGVDSVLREDVV